MKLSKLIRELKESENLEVVDREISGITNDSRKVKPGFMFVAIEGYKLDGHNYVTDAINSGAGAIITEKYINNVTNVAQIVVNDGRKALSRLSSCFFWQPSKKIKTIGVTGTNGKTTTTYLIKSIIDSAVRDSKLITYHPPDEADSGLKSHVGLIGTIEYIIGRDVLPARETTPESVDTQDLLSRMIAQNLEYAVIEVSSQALVQHRVDDVEFYAATYTNITPEHLDYHRNFSKYKAAKAMLFEQLDSNAFAIFNADDDAGKYFAKRTKANVIWYGIENDADVRCKVLKFLPDSTDIVLSYKKEKIKIKLPMIGLHNVYNVLAAAANGVALGMDLDTIKNGVCKFHNVPGRLERIDYGQSFKVFVDYAHTAHALDVVLHSLRQSKLNGGRLLLVFGCGGDRDRQKRSEMGKVADKLADRFWITNDNPRSEDPLEIIDEIKAGIDNRGVYSVQPDRKLAIQEAIQDANEKDIILIAGKGHETSQIIGDNVYQFSDRDIVKETLFALRN
ncbi:MAG: UDP-N-acetylmuramoyl-L-alanyl-D-glutamate--2,6-diaminopimelate ligase [Candidatus Anammoxibacter sp.]